MRIVRDGGYRGHVGVESGARAQEGEADAIRATRDLLQRVAAEQAKCRPIFNGQDIAGWQQLEGGEWTVVDGVLIGRNGRGWSTDPQRSGSWLRTARTYADFRLELQYAINTRGNSGVLFRAGPERNPSFTGYELQIFDGQGRPATDRGPSSIYQVAAPSKNLVRAADEWNTVTIVARGPQIIVEMNGERVIDTQQTRSMEGYIGLQNHDERSEVRFRNIRLEVL
jgi:hypothetical protein